MAAEDGTTQLDEATREEIVRGLDRSMLVEAAAGTGKTTLLIDRILHGLREGTFRLPRTVAITFTEKAAGELESRRENLARALEEIDRANISTIHAFCAGLLRERPADAAVDPEFEVLDQVQADLLFDQCWERWMGEQVRACPNALVEILRAGVRIGDGGPRSSGLKALAATLAKSPEALDARRFPLHRPAEPVEVLVARLHQMAPSVLSFLRENARKGGGNKDYRAVKEFLNKLLQVPERDVRAATRLIYRFTHTDAQKALGSLTPDARPRAAELLTEVTLLTSKITAHLAADVFDWMKGFVDFYQSEKWRRSVLDFQDLLARAADMLRQNRSVRAYFKRRFDAFFVDEFQDTDPLQAEIVAFLCERRDREADDMEQVELEEGKLFVVGDPKQSIYRFRRADVGTYERFKRLFVRQGAPDAAVRNIYQNFRSTPSLLQGLNELFSRIFEQPDKEGVYQARHVDLAPARGKWPPGKGAPGILALCPPPGVAALMETALEARRYEARCLALCINALVRGEVAGFRTTPLRYREIACLFSALTDVSIYEEAFEEYAIPYRVVGGHHFYMTQEVGETLALLRAVDDPLDEIAVVAALRSSYFAVSDEELFAFREQGGRWNYLLSPRIDGPAGEAVQLLAEWHQRRNQSPPHVLLGQILDHTKALEAYLLKPNGEQRAANVEKLLSQLRMLWGASHGSFRSIVAHLASLHERAAEEEESSVVEPEDDFVRIMTIHKSKGLQFGAVVLPDLARGFRGKDSVEPLLIDRATRHLEVRPAGKITSEGYDELAQTESDNLRAERARQLYVACTRAERCLVLPLYWRKNGGKKEDCLLAFLEQTGRLAPAGEVPYGLEKDNVFYVDTRQWQEELSASEHQAAGTKKVTEKACEELLRDREKWQEQRKELIARATAAPPLVWPSAQEGDIVPSPRAEESPFAFEGKGFGSLFHHVMHAMPLRPEERGGDFERLVHDLASPLLCATAPVTGMRRGYRRLPGRKHRPARYRQRRREYH